MMLNIGGQRVEVTNFDEWKAELLSKIALFVETEIENNVERMGLVGQGKGGPNLSGSYIAREENGEIFITSTAEHAIYIEFGTLKYWQLFGEDTFPEPGYPNYHPKKKELPAKEAKQFPSGMQPFAVIRRVIWNQKVMERVIRNALRS